MNKQEFLAISLPYGLYCEVSNKKVTYKCVRQNNIDYALEFHDKAIVSCPILHPLSDIAKPIEHNGEKFVPIIRLGWAYSIIGWSQSNIMTAINNLLLKDALLLISWHFDIANLIEKGEAINVNTLSENPYK